MSNYALGLTEPHKDNIPTSMNIKPSIINTPNGYTVSFYDISDTDIDLKSIDGFFYDYLKSVQPSEPTIDYDYTDDSLEEVLNNDELDYLKNLYAIKKESLKEDLDENINYEKVDVPEGIKIDNLIDIPDSELKATLKNKEKLFKGVSKLLLQENAAFVLSLDQAVTYANTALNDGLSIRADIDDNVLEAITPIIRLSIIEYYLNKSSLSKEYKSMYMEHLTKLFAEYANNKITLKDRSDKTTSLMNHVRGRVTKEQPSNDRSRLGYGKSRGGRELVRKTKDEERA